MNKGKKVSENGCGESRRGHGLMNPAELVHRSLKQFHETIEGALDPMGVMAPMVHAQLAWLSHPQELTECAFSLSSDLWRLQWHSLSRLAGLPSEDPVRPHVDDLRFADPEWTEVPGWDLVKEWYLAMTRHVQDMLYETPGLSGKERRRAAFWWREWLNAVAPTNCLWTNPVALRKAVESGGDSLLQGWRNCMDDLEAGSVRMTDPADFKVGENLATTTGTVVLRNRLLEVIHYHPTRPQVRVEPLLIITPWINKFYVLDLTPRKSMIRFLLDQGVDVFITSWKNPDASMADVRFDDYLFEGVHAAVEAARLFTGTARVHAAGYCIGGTALAMYMAWANRKFGPEATPVADWTLFTTLVDFHKPGDIEVFIDPVSIRYLADKMARQGYLDGAEMASSFRLLRSNSLIWHYVVQGWLYGEKPPPFDVLYWNMDTTRMPAAMHEWYLRELYLNNRLIQSDELTVAGEALDLKHVQQPLYAVAAEDDHIAPWRQTFLINNHVAGDKRFVLSSSGHILGIVNPVVKPSRRKYRAAAAHRSDTADLWLHGTTEVSGSWWEDWMRWLLPRMGGLVEARIASADLPDLGAAPGSYVLEP